MCSRAAICSGVAIPPRDEGASSLSALRYMYPSLNAYEMDAPGDAVQHGHGRGDRHGRSDPPQAPARRQMHQTDGACCVRSLSVSLGFATWSRTDSVRQSGWPCEWDGASDPQASSRLIDVGSS